MGVMLVEEDVFYFLQLQLVLFSKISKIKSSHFDRAHATPAYSHTHHSWLMITFNIYNCTVWRLLVMGIMFRTY